MPVRRRKTLAAAAAIATIAMASVSMPCRAGACQGELAIDGIGAQTYLAGGGGYMSNSSHSLTLHHNSGYSLMNACNGDWGFKDFYQLDLLGKTFEFTVDLSGVGCACNLAVYLISAPAG